MVTILPRDEETQHELYVITITASKGLSESYEYITLPPDIFLSYDYFRFKYFNTDISYTSIGHVSFTRDGTISFENIPEPFTEEYHFYKNQMYITGDQWVSGTKLTNGSAVDPFNHRDGLDRFSWGNKRFYHPDDDSVY